MRYLITQSLISSWNYLHSCREECEEEAYADFLATLNREPKEATKAMQNGIDFENLVYSIAAGRVLDESVKWFYGASAVATYIKGTPVQVKAQRELTIGDTTILAYGILDALKAGTIYDVKFSNKSFGSADLAGKYLDSPQHPAYLYMVPESSRFVYLVSDGNDLYTEEYTRKNTRPFEDIVKEFLESLKAMNLLDVYKAKWESK